MNFAVQRYDYYWYLTVT